MSQNRETLKDWLTHHICCSDKLLLCAHNQTHTATAANPMSLPRKTLKYDMCVRLVATLAHSAMVVVVVSCEQGERNISKTRSLATTQRFDGRLLVSDNGNCKSLEKSNADFCTKYERINEYDSKANEGVSSLESFL